MSLRAIAGHIKHKLFYNYAHLRYNLASKQRYFLNEKDFETFVNKYKNVEAKAMWDYSDEGQEALAKERFKMLIAQNNGVVPQSVCEIGPGSGMLLKQFLDAGSTTVLGVDIQKPNNLDPRITYHMGGVHELDNLPDNSIDFMYSIDAFEHIPNPTEGINNCLNKLKPGAKFYLQVGPTYYSPWGFHFYHILKIPYIHVLFPEEYLEAYAKKHNHQFPWTNRVPASAYMHYFNNLPAHTQLLSLRYDYIWFCTRLLARYADVFKAKQGVAFDDYFIGAIFTVLKKSSTTEYLR
jgi:SAM-dependent methyltransferase